MRKLLLLSVFGCCFLNGIWAQYNCQGEVIDSIESQYFQDAEQLVARSLDLEFKENSGLIQSIDLPEDQLSSVFSALMAIYQDQDLPHWEEVIEQYRIHSKTEVETHSIRLLVNTEFLWTDGNTENLLKVKSGSDLLDQLLFGYEFSLKEDAQVVLLDNDTNTYLEIALSSKKAININALLQVIGNIEGVVDANMILDSNTGATEKDIQLLRTDAYYQFTFRYSWDCDDSTDCASNHFWTYRVFPDCSTAFVEESGSTLPVREVASFVATRLYPNPTTDRVSVQLLGPTGKDIHVVLFSALGQIIQSEFVQSQSGLIKLDYSLKDLPVGMYFLGLVSEGKVLTEKILKR